MPTDFISQSGISQSYYGTRSDAIESTCTRNKRARNKLEVPLMFHWAKFVLVAVGTSSQRGGADICYWQHQCTTRRCCPSFTLHHAKLSVQFLLWSEHQKIIGACVTSKRLLQLHMYSRECNGNNFEKAQSIPLHWSPIGCNKLADRFHLLVFIPSKCNVM